MKTEMQKIHDLIEKFDTAMLVTHGRDGFERARPMAIAHVEPNGSIWFFTGRVSEKVREILVDDEVLLVMQKDHSLYLSLSGHATLVDNSAKAAELWREAYKTWFPGGVNDPNLLLVRVSANLVEYWDNTGLNGIKYLFESAKAYVQGVPPKVSEPEQHDRVRFS
jgi:general stress protein 26